MSQPSVKIVAMVSNEAYYLPQWVYHHFFFGFNAIELYVNRTFDNTIDIIDKLKIKYPHIIYHDYDWIDLLFPEGVPKHGFQYGPYLQSYYNCEKCYDYILFIDIDEFWFPKNCKDSIQDCIKKLGWPNVISFNWFCIGGNECYVMPCLSNRFLRGYNCNTPKSIIKTNLKPNHICHLPKFSNVDKYVTAEGEDVYHYKKEPNCMRKFDITYMHDYFIIHDISKTKISYLARIANGSMGFSQFKSLSNARTYRPTWWPLYEESSENELINRPNAFTSPPLTFECELSNEYFKGFTELWETLDLEKYYAKSLEINYLQALETLRLLEANPEHPLSMKYMKFIKNIKLLRNEIINELCCINHEYSTISDLDINYINAIETYEEKDAIRYFNKIIMLYPLSRTENNEPLFLKLFIDYLCKNGKVNKVIEIAQNKSIMSNRIFGTDWIDKIIGITLKNNGHYIEALRYLNKQSHALDPEIYDCLYNVKL